MAASHIQCDTVCLWFGVHKQFSLQMSLVNASCHSRRRSLCCGLLGGKRFSEFMFISHIEARLQLVC